MGKNQKVLISTGPGLNPELVALVSNNFIILIITNEKPQNNYDKD